MFDAFFEKAGEAAATPPDYIKLFTLLLAAYPLSYPLPSLAPNIKHLANISVSFFFVFLILNLHGGYLQLLFSALGTWAMAKYNVGGKRMPWIVFAFAMGHLTVNHLIRAFGNIPLTTIEITAAQMVLVMNLTSFAWSAFDGRRDPDKLDSQQLSMRITPDEFPNLLEFLGWVFYFPGILVGPSTRFVDYRLWASGELYQSAKGRERVPVRAKESIKALPPPGRFRNGALELALGIGYMGLWAALAPKFDYMHFVLPSSDPKSALRYGFWGRILLCQLAGFQARTKYYGIWTLTNGACVLSGLSYNGLRPAKRPAPFSGGGGASSSNGKAAVAAQEGQVSDEVALRTRWDRCRNIDVGGIEFANNWKELLDNWNMNTNVWLRNNVYKRVAKPGRKPGFKSTMMTFITSAFWHGVAPGYYVTFVLGGLDQSIGKSLRKHLRTVVFPDPRAPNPSFSTLRHYTPAQLGYCAVSIIFLQLTMNFTVIPFMLLEVGLAMKAWRALYYYGLVLVLGGMAFFRAGGGRFLDSVTGVAARKKREAEQKRKKEEALKAGNPQVLDVDAAEAEARRAAEIAAERVHELVDGEDDKNK